MKFLEAVELASKKSNLIGTSTDKGGTIDDIIIVPTDPREREGFIRSYLMSFNAQQSIVPYINSDVQVLAIDKERIREQNIFIYTTIDPE